jgi:hypothetical protein
MAGAAVSLAQWLMKSLRQLGFIKLPFRKEVPAEEDGRVLALFRNRAELKKAYGELQEEVYRLKDRIKQQEGATQRVQEMLVALEARLGVPESAYPALVFYQLRRLWQSGRELVEQFVEDLSRQQDERERRQHVAEHNRRQFAQRQALDSQLNEARARAERASSHLTNLQAERARLKRFWHYFKRRALDQRITAGTAASVQADEGLAAASAAVQAALEQDPVPEFPGLSLEARRAINLAAVALAEVLCIRLAGTNLVQLAKEATARREVADEYGTPRECEAVMAEIENAYTLIQSRNNIAQEIKARSDRLKQVARYRNAPDTTPTADSIALTAGDVLVSGAVGSSAARVPNVLAEDTWDLFRILLR